MNKKGFTLVELLAVIVLLTLLGVFTVSTILDKTDEKKNKIDSTTENLLKTAAQNYIFKNKGSFNQTLGNVYCLKVSDVLTSEDIKNINANSENSIDESKTYVKVTFLKDSASYDVVDTCSSNEQVLPNNPLLASNMIPIKWDKNNNIVMPDIGTYGDWYNYDEGRWANAIIVPQELLSKFKSLKPGELIIPFNEIVDEVMFVVWIPSFEYSPKGGSKFEADLKFTIGISSKSHPAFSNISGFWIGKFELTTLNNSVSLIGNELNSSYSQKAYTDTFKNMNDKINALYTSSYRFLDNEVTLRMIENREWAATAFLTHSKYGLKTEKVLASDIYTGTIANFSLKEINSYQKYPVSKLSYGIDHFANYTNEIYYSENSVFASTTRNVTGVYGLNGGNNEWVISKYCLNYEDESTCASLNEEVLDEALTNSYISGKYDSYVGTYNTSVCLTRGGGKENNGIFAFNSQTCNAYNTSRLVIKVK